jgi:hypothetical protein
MLGASKSEVNLGKVVFLLVPEYESEVDAKCSFDIFPCHVLFLNWAVFSLEAVT